MNIHMPKGMKPRYTYINIHKNGKILDSKQTSLNPTLDVRLNPKRNLMMTGTTKEKKIISL